jgi:serine/threonine protein kinase
MIATGWLLAWFVRYHCTFVLEPSSQERNLRQVIDVGLPIPRLLGIVAAVCDRLAEAHERGEAHHGLTPGNIHIRDDGITIDGWVKAGERAPPEAVGYLAPELARDAAQAGPEADLFAVGAILYECLTGRRAFAGATPLHVRLAVLEGQPTSPSDLGAPPALSDLCMALLAKRKDLRPGTLREVRDALEPFVEGAIRTPRSLSLATVSPGREQPGALVSAAARHTAFPQVAGLRVVDPGCYEIGGSSPRGGWAGSCARATRASGVRSR